MEVQVQLEQVRKHIASYASNGFLRDRGEYCVAQFLEDCASNSSRAIFMSVSVL